MYVTFLFNRFNSRGGMCQGTEFLALDSTKNLSKKSTKGSDVLLCDSWSFCFIDN